METHNADSSMNTRTSYLKEIRHKLRPRQRAKDAWNRLSRRAGLLKGNRSEALGEEARFWEHALKEEGRYWVPAEYQRRMDPQLDLQEDLKGLMQAPPGAVVRVLDVGAGPLTNVGKRWEGRTVELVPVDPLADEYKAILKRLKLRPPVLTEPADGENLVEKFEKNSFDLVCAYNSLDHSQDPLKAIQQMFAVVKPGGYVYLNHYANEGLKEGYKGMHQWNFDIKNGDVILSDGRGINHSLATEFKDKGLLKAEFQSAFGAAVVVGKIKKLEAS
jgi:SAM-dependent methyltransferase